MLDRPFSEFPPLASTVRMLSRFLSLQFPNSAGNRHTLVLSGLKHLHISANNCHIATGDDGDGDGALAPGTTA